MDKDNLAYKKMTSTGSTVTQNITIKITNCHMPWASKKNGPDPGMYTAKQELSQTGFVRPVW
jgi:hypothetical protein